MVLARAFMAFAVTAVFVLLVPPAPEVQAACNGVRIASGENIQRAIDQRGAGTAFCLTGTYTIRTTIKPKNGTVLRGPAVLVAANGVDQGIDATKASGVQLISLEIRGFDDRAFKCGERSVVRASYFHHNGRNGMGGGECHYLLVVDSRFTDNGNLDELGQGSAGIKIAGSDHAVIRGNLVEDNTGVGIWCDEDCRDWLVEGNRAFRNGRKGIFLEKGAGAIIRNNTSRNNNYLRQAVGGGIGAVSSIDVQIYGNLLGGNTAHGIKVWDDRRGYRLDDVTIHHNDLDGDQLSGCNEDGVTCTSNTNVE